MFVNDAARDDNRGPQCHAANNNAIQCRSRCPSLSTAYFQSVPGQGAGILIRILLTGLARLHIVWIKWRSFECHASTTTLRIPAIIVVFWLLPVLLVLLLLRTFNETGFRLNGRTRSSDEYSRSRCERSGREIISRDNSGYWTELTEWRSQRININIPKPPEERTEGRWWRMNRQIIFTASGYWNWMAAAPLQIKSILSSWQALKFTNSAINCSSDWRPTKKRTEELNDQQSSDRELLRQRKLCSSSLEFIGLLTKKDRNLEWPDTGQWKCKLMKWKCTLIDWTEYNSTQETIGHQTIDWLDRAKPEKTSGVAVFH